jgi:hypothetical protein
MTPDDLDRQHVMLSSWNFHVMEPRDVDHDHVIVI